MSRPMMSISKDLAVSPRDSSRTAITAKTLFSSKVPFLESRKKYGWKKKRKLEQRTSSTLAQVKMILHTFYINPNPFTKVISSLQFNLSKWAQ